MVNVDLFLPPNGVSELLEYLKWPYHSQLKVKPQSSKSTWMTLPCHLQCRRESGVSTDRWILNFLDIGKIVWRYSVTRSPRFRIVKDNLRLHSDSRSQKLYCLHWIVKFSAIQEQTSSLPPSNPLLTPDGPTLYKSSDSIPPASAVHCGHNPNVQQAQGSLFINQSVTDRRFVTQWAHSTVSRCALPLQYWFHFL